jgi:hypothetical protein
MGAVADFLHDEGLNGKGVDAIKKVEGIFSAVSGISGYIGVLKDFFDPEDQLQKAVDKIIQAFRDALAADDLKFDMINVGDKLASAETAWSDLKEDPPHDASGDPSTWPMWPDVTGRSKDALFALSQPGYWRRPFLGIEYQDPPWTYYWPFFSGQKMTPPDLGGGLVFDYRVTLPAFLEAVTIRLIIVQSVVKGWRDKDEYVSEFRNWASVLQEEFKTIRDGIQEIHPPTLEMTVGGVLWPVPPAPGRPPDRYTWMGIGGRFGAVEINSTFHAVDQWPAGHWPNEEDFSPKNVKGYYDAFRISHLIGTMARWKKVYREIGLPAVAKIRPRLEDCGILVQLKALLGEPVTPERDPATGRVDRRSGDWSVLELVQRLQSYTLAQTGSDLGLVGPLGIISLRGVLKALWGNSFNQQPEAYTSLRAAVAWP